MSPFLPTLPPGPVPPASTTFSRPTSPKSGPLPRRGTELGAFQCNDRPYSASLVHIPLPTQNLPPASPPPKVGTNNLRPETAGDTSQWSIWLTGFEPPNGPAHVGGRHPRL